MESGATPHPTSPPTLTTPALSSSSTRHQTPAPWTLCIMWTTLTLALLLSCSLALLLSYSLTLLLSYSLTLLLHPHPLPHVYLHVYPHLYPSPLTFHLRLFSFFTFCLFTFYLLPLPLPLPIPMPILFTFTFTVTFTLPLPVCRWRKLMECDGRMDS